jgi:hypothetical protein
MLGAVPAMTIDGAELVVTLERNERWWGFLRDLRVPIGLVTAVEVVPEGRRAVHGLRAPGLGGPQRLIGTWRARNDRQYVCVRRHQPAVKVTLNGHNYRTVVIGLDEADRVAGEVRFAAGL